MQPPIDLRAFLCLFHLFQHLFGSSFMESNSSCVLLQRELNLKLFKEGASGEDVSAVPSSVFVFCKQEHVCLRL